MGFFRIRIHMTFNWVFEIQIDNGFYPAKNKKHPFDNLYYCFLFQPCNGDFGYGEDSACRGAGGGNRTWGSGGQQEGGRQTLPSRQGCSDSSSQLDC